VPQTYLLTVLILLPAAGTLALLLLGDDDHLWIRRLALITAVVEFGISLLLLWGFDSGMTGFQFEENRRWISDPPIHYHVGIDGLSLFLVLLTTFLTPIAILCSWRSINSQVKGFFISMLVLESGVVGVFVSLDLFLFFLFWEVMLIPMYLLIGVWGHHHRIYAALKFILYTMFGSILMLVAILWLYHITALNGSPTFDLVQIQTLLSSGKLALSQRTEMLLFGAFFLAFAIKVPLFPLHTWLPDAHTEAPTAGSVILAGVLLKMGTYGMLRFCLPLFPDACRKFSPEIAVLAIIGIIYGALVAMVQVDLKRLVAYSSVSHLGFVVLGIFAFHPTSIDGAIYQMLNHGISTGALFLGVGMLYDRRQTHLIEGYGGLAGPMPVFAAMYLFACFSSAGLPMLNGFVGEFLILAGTFQRHAAWASCAAIGMVLSAVYLLWSYQRVFFGDVDDRNRTMPDLEMREKGILSLMAVMMLWMGIGSPFFTRRMETATQNILDQMQRPAAAYDARSSQNNDLRQFIPAANAEVRARNDSPGQFAARAAGFEGRASRGERRRSIRQDIKSVSSPGGLTPEDSNSPFPQIENR
jgi:NADH-quinone oxidoreductase subunit M